MEDEEHRVPEDSFESRLLLLRSSSLTAQTEVLRKIQADIEDSEHKTDHVLPLLPHLLLTYSRQFQRKPRRLVQSCLRALLRSGVRDTVQPAISNFLLAESLKVVVAVTNALVLLEWSHILLEEVTARNDLDLNVLRQTCTAAAAFLDKCLTQGTRGGISHAASVSARRGIRKALQSQHADKALHAMLTELAQSASARPATSPYIGLLARASVRVPSLREQVASLADKIIDYFTKVILGSKTPLPWHEVHGLDAFFAEYAVSGSITSTVVPALEKAILRAPENVLQGPIVALALSLPPSIDFAESVLTKLLKPLSSSLASTNVAIRDGAAQTLSALLTRGGEKSAMSKIVKELVATAKTSKTSASDVRCAISDCLGNIAVEPELSLAVLQGLLPIAAKENNETALDRELIAIATHASALIDSDQWTKELSDYMFKGFVEKRMPFRKLWILNAGKALLGMTRKPQAQVVTDFVDRSLSAAIDVYEELSQHPLPAAQAGTIAMAYVLPALLQNSIVTEMLSGMKTKASPKYIGSSAVHSTSYLTNPKVYARLLVAGDQHWALLALMGVSDYLIDADDAGKAGWGRMFLHLLLAPEIDSSTRKNAGLLLAKRYLDNPAPIGQSVVLGIWDYIRENTSNAPKRAKAEELPAKQPLKRAVTCISPPAKVWKSEQRALPTEALEQQAVSTVVLYGPKLVPGVEWAENLLQIGVDPGQLAHDHSEALMGKILSCFEHGSLQPLSLLEAEACRAAATLVFVSPSEFGPRIVEQIKDDLKESSLHGVGSTEVSIALTPDGVLVIDPNATSNGHVENKNVKDYKTLKWEEELKAELAKKKGTQKKLTSDQQAKVDAQLKREAEVRQKVKDLSHKLRRGAGLVNALAVGPPTDARLWMSPAVASITAVLRAGAALCTDEELVAAYLACSHHVTDRLGTMRPFIGVAALRALGNVGVPPAMEAEPLEELATRVLYRLRFAAEQRPLDTASLAYSLPLIFTTLEAGGIGNIASAEDADAQVLLALEFLSFQMDTCTDEHLPRAELLKQLISAMQRYPQHYRLVKDTLIQLASSVAANISSGEQEVLLQATTSADGSVRSAALQSIHTELDLSDSDPSVNIWIACQDADEDNAETALAIWQESGFDIFDNLVQQIPPFLFDKAQSTRSSAAKALAQALLATPTAVPDMRVQLQTWYQEEAQPLVPKADKFGIVQRGEIVDPWHRRSGIALAFKELSDVYLSDDLLPLIDFLVSDGALADRNERVRDEMLDAGTTLVTRRGKECLESLMSFFEKVLKQTDKATKEADLVNEGVIVLYGFLAMHLPKGDPRLKNVLSELVQTLSTPSESVQYAVANCLPPLVRAAGSDADPHIPALLEQLLQGKQYAVRRGAAYGLAGIVKGDGISVLRQFRIMSALKTATDDKKNAEKRQGAMMAYELLSSILGRTFEPYVVDVLPQLLACFGDPVPIVRDACLDTAKACFSSLSSYGVHQVLPQLLEGLEETQWRSKKGACDLLGAMAYLDPQQLAASLPDIIPPLTAVLTDSHKEVRASANSSLKRFGEVISNPEVKSLVDVLLKALSDPTKYTEDALDGLIKISFTHYLDSPSLALIVRILERGLNDRSSTKRKAAQIIGSLAHLTEKRDIVIHLPILVSGLRAAAIDPVPATRATASKALGSLVEKLGEDALPDLIPSLMGSLRTDAGASDRLGSAQALSEVLAGLGTGRLEETLPTILQNVASTRATVREGFMTLFIFLPACFGNSFANYLAQIIPSVLSGLADDIEAIRDTALRAGRLLVKNFATKSIDLLLPELQRGLADNNYRIRLSSVELVGDLLFNLTGISAKMEAEEEEVDTAAQAGQSLLEVLGEDRRNRVLSSLYICRCDTSGLVRTAALAVWKALVATPRTLREIVPTLTQMIITRLGSVNAEQKHIAANALGEVIRKSGEGIFNSLLPALEEGLESSTDADNRQGICIALREVITAAQHEAIEDHEQKIIAILRTALVDSDDDVRDAAADAFDSLQQIVGNRAVNQVLPHLLKLLSNDDDAENALAALLTLLTEQTRANAILPNLIPTLIASPISAFNAQALASLAKVGGSAMNRRLPTILNSLADNIIACKDDDRKTALESAFNAVLCSVDEFDGLNTAMSVMLQMIKHDDHHRRSVAAKHLAVFFTSSGVDFSRYNQDLIRVLLISFDDRDKVVVSTAWNALSALQQHLRKEEMESLTPYTTQTLRQVGTPGHNLPGFMLPKGIQPVMQILLQGLMNGNGDQRLQAAHGITDMIDKAGPDALKAFVTQITGPLIRVVGDKSTDLKIAIINALIQLLEKIATFLRPFLPQLQRTFTKCIADPASDTLRNKAIRALSILIAYTPRVDPLITELTTGAKTPDPAVRNSMLKALQEVVGKVGAKMSEASRDTILDLMDQQTADEGDLMVTMAKLLGGMVKVLPPETGSSLIKSRVLVQPSTPASILALNAVLAENAHALTDTHLAQIRATLIAGVQGPTFIQHNSVLAIGKLFLTDDIIEDEENNRPVFDVIASKIKQGTDLDTRRLCLVVIRTLSRHHNETTRAYIPLLILPIYQSLRDPVIPVKLAAEAAFLQLFDVVDSESEVFDQFVKDNTEAGSSGIPAPVLRSVSEYFKRIALKLAGQRREQREAEGGVKGSLGLGSDEVEDEKEVWSVGKVDLGEGFSVDD